MIGATQKKGKGKMEKRISFGDALEQNNYTLVCEYITEITDQLKANLINSELAALEKSIEREKTHLSYFVKKELVQQNIDFIFGRYIGFVDAIYEHLAKAYKEKSLKDGLNSCDIFEIPHVNDIIVTIHTNPGIRHGKLAEEVGIEKSTLTGIMDKLIDKDVVNYSRPGKYKYYYLSDLGTTYYENNKNIIDAETDVKALTEQLLIALSREEDANGKLLQIITSLCTGKSAFQGYYSKAVEKLELAQIFAGIPTIKQLRVLYPDLSLHTVDNGCVFKLNSQDPIVSLFGKKPSNMFVVYPAPQTLKIVNG